MLYCAWVLIIWSHNRLSFHRARLSPIEVPPRVTSRGEWPNVPLARMLIETICLNISEVPSIKSIRERTVSPWICILSLCRMQFTPEIVQTQLSKQLTHRGESVCVDLFRYRVPILYFIKNIVNYSISRTGRGDILPIKFENIWSTSHEYGGGIYTLAITKHLLYQTVCNAKIHISHVCLFMPVCRRNCQLCITG